MLVYKLKFSRKRQIYAFKFKIKDFLWRLTNVESIVMKYLNKQQYAAFMMKVYILKILR